MRPMLSSEAEYRLTRVRVALARRLRLVPREPAVAASLAGYRERALCRVMVAARSVCEDWTAGVDIDRSIAALHAEITSAAEYDISV